MEEVEVTLTAYEPHNPSWAPSYDNRDPVAPYGIRLPLGLPIPGINRTLPAPFTDACGPEFPVGRNNLFHAALPALAYSSIGTFLS
jgi:hypothetical protein